MGKIRVDSPWPRNYTPAAIRKLEDAEMDLATIDHLLTTTRSVRKRLDLTRPVELEVVEKCIELALQAPTGSNLQGWHFMAQSGERNLP